MIWEEIAQNTIKNIKCTKCRKTRFFDSIRIKSSRELSNNECYHKVLPLNELIYVSQHETEVAIVVSSLF